jgi:hypothetical protein
MQNLTSAAAFAAFLAAPAFAGPFDGNYRPDQPWAETWDCVNVGVDGGALAIYSDVYTGVGNACRLSNPEPVDGMDAVFYDAECMGEGEVYEMRLMILRLAEGIAIIEDGFVNQLKSCPTP